MESYKMYCFFSLLELLDLNEANTVQCSTWKANKYFVLILFTTAVACWG